MDDLKKQAIEREIERAKAGVEAAMSELRYALDRIERDIKAGRKPTVSSTHQATELFNALGRYEAMLTAREIFEVKL